MIGPLRDLIVFATRERSVEAGLSVFPARTASPKLVDFEQLAAEVRICRATPLEPPVQRTSTYYSLLLNPAAVPDAIGLVASWYELRGRLGPVWALLFGTLLRPDLPLENRFLNLTAFAEAYHRTLHDERPLSREEANAGRETMLDHARRG